MHFERVRFIAPELNGRVGERIQVRYIPHDLRQIEIFHGDTWLCTAYPQGQLTAEQRSAVLGAVTRTPPSWAGGSAGRAAVPARSWPRSPRPARGGHHVVSITPARSAGAARATAGTMTGIASCSRLGRTDLLGLHRDFDYWNPPRAGQPRAPASEVEPAATGKDKDRVEDEDGGRP